RRRRAQRAAGALKKIRLQKYPLYTPDFCRQLSLTNSLTNWRGYMHFLFHIDEQNTEPLYKQICDSIKTAILEGRLKQGDKLPSSRTLSDTLGVSRVTAS